MVDFVEFPKIARLAREIIVTEKIDGSNGVIYVGEDGEVLAGSRSQWITTRAKGGADNFGFATWVEAHANELRGLGPGRHYGEWWGSGIQRGYGLTKGEKRFSLFNVHRWSTEMAEVPPLPRPACCHVVPVLYRGMFLTDEVERCLERLKAEGSLASPGFMKPEGVIVFHPQGNVGFKKTIEKDAEWKGKERRDPPVLIEQRWIEQERTMNKRRLLKLADLLETGAKNPKGVKFDLGTWGGDASGGKKPMGMHCGTTACAMGLAALSGAFRRQGLRYEITQGNYDVPDDLKVYFGDNDGLDAARGLFAISYDEAEWLFTVVSYTQDKWHGAKGERAVAKRIRDFVAGKAQPI